MLLKFSALAVCLPFFVNVGAAPTTYSFIMYPDAKDNLAIQCNLTAGTSDPSVATIPFATFSVATEAADTFEYDPLVNLSPPSSYSGRAPRAFISYDVNGTVYSPTWTCLQSSGAATPLSQSLVETLVGVYDEPIAVLPYLPRGLLGLAYSPANTTTDTFVEELFPITSTPAVPNTTVLAIGKQTLNADETTISYSGISKLSFGLAVPTASATVTSFAVWQPSRGFWGLQLTGAAAGTSILNYNGFAVLASGTPFTIVPVMAFYTIVSAALGPSATSLITKDPYSGAYRYRLTSTDLTVCPAAVTAATLYQNVALNFTSVAPASTKTFTLTPTDYYFQNNVGCQLNFIGYDINYGAEFSSGPAWYLGGAFMQNKITTLSYTLGTNSSNKKMIYIQEGGAGSGSGGCLAPSTCQVGYVCSTPDCILEGSLGTDCLTGSNCQPGYSCVATKCQVQSCPTGNECAAVPGTTCVAGVCLLPCDASETNKTIGCPSDMECSTNGFCALPEPSAHPCVTVLDCTSVFGLGSSCVSNTCQQALTTGCLGDVFPGCTTTPLATCVRALSTEIGVCVIV